MERAVELSNNDRMKMIHSIAVLFALCASGVAWGDGAAQIDIDVSRNGVIETIVSPEKLSALLLSIAQHSQASSQEDPAAHWDEVFTQPNWIRASFVPARQMRLAAGKRDAATRVSEILVLFPTSPQGRRWPDFILLKTDVGVVSVARWSVCEMSNLVAEASFELKDEAVTYQRYRNVCRAANADEGLAPAPR
jgi:hypothetical protein